MKKYDEIELMKTMLNNKDKTPREIIKESNLNIKRGHYLLTKWTNKGLYNYGVALDKGWLTNKGVKVFKDILTSKWEINDE